MSRPFAARSLVEELSPSQEVGDAMAAFADQPGLIVLESALVREPTGRYSFLTADPFEWLQARASRTSVSGEARVREPADPFAVLEEHVLAGRVVPVAQSFLFRKN